MKSIRSRQAITFIFLLLPVLLLAVYSFFQTRQQLIRHVYEERKGLATISAKMLHEKLDRLSEIGHSFSTWPSFRQGFEDGRWEHAISMMNSITRDFPYISNVFITDTAGKVMADYTKVGGTKTDLRNFSKWYSGVRKTWQPYLSEVYNYPEKPGQITSALAIPLNNMSGKLSGVLVLEVNINRLLEWSSEIDVGKDGFVYIVDQKGNIAINPNYKQSDSVINYSSVPAVQKALQGKNDVEILYNPVTKERSLCAYEQVPVYGWAVIVQEEAGAALSVNHSIRTVLIFYLFFILLAVGLIWIILRGLSRQRKTALELKKSDDNIHLLVDNVKDYAIFMLDKNGLVTNWNKGAEQIKGYKTPEILGQSMDKFYSAEDIQKGIPAQNLAIAAREGNMESDGWRVKKDGSLFWANTLITALKDESGALYGYSKITRDITERKKTQELLKAANEQLEQKVKERTEQINRSEKQYRHLFGNNPMPMWVMNETSFQFLDVNEMALQHYGYSREEFLSLTALDIRPPADQSIFMQVNRRADTDIENKNRRIWNHLKKNGCIIQVEVISHSISFENKKARLIMANDVTEKIAAEEKLLASEKRFRALIENNYDVINLVDESLNVIYRSPSSERVTGLTDKDILGVSIARSVHPEETEMVAAIIKETFANPGKAIPCKIRSRHKDGHYLWLEGMVTNLLHNKNVNAVLLNFRDVTERIEAEEKVKEQKAQLQTLGDNLNGVMIYQLIGHEDGSRQFTYISNGITKLTGKTPEEVMKDPAILYNMILEEDLPGFLAAELEAGEQLAVFNREVRCRTQNNEIRWLNIVSTPRKQANGLIVWDGFHIDITDQKEIAKKIADSEARFRSLIENSTDAIVINDADSTILYQSPSVSNILGYELAERQHKKSIDYVHPESRDEFIRLYEKLKVTPNQPLPFQYRFLHKNGRYVWLEGVVTNWLDDPKVKAYVANYRDITERKEAEENIKHLNENLEIKVQQRTEQLKKINEELEAFSYSVSHDLRAPLRGIVGFTSILEEDYSSKLDDEAIRITGIIKNNTLKMGNLIDDLLSFSRVGRHQIEKALLNNNEIVQQVIAGIEQKNNSAIEWNISSLHTAYGDINTIRQVWVNLISNSVKYSSGNTRQHIEIGSYLKDDQIVFFVKDNGVGFDEKYAGKLFKVFQRLHGSNEFEGTGVGLAIVEKIISKHGGRVWAKAEKGVGATFYFSLPVDNNFSI